MDIGDEQRPANIKVRLFHKISVEFKTRIPTEQEFFIFFRPLRTEKGMASLNMWTAHSMINSTIKRKYVIDHVKCMDIMV